MDSDHITEADQQNSRKKQEIEATNHGCQVLTSPEAINIFSHNWTVTRFFSTREGCDV